MQDIRDTLVNITKSVTKTSGDLLKSTKLSMSLSTEETNLKNLYFEIGKKVHEIYMYGGSLGKFFDEKFLELEACERKIAEIREQISVIKGVKNCPKCGKSVERSAEFCQKCGIRVELTSVASLPSEEHAGIVEQRANSDMGQVYDELLPKADLPSPLSVALPEVIPQTEQLLRNCRVCNSKNDNTSKFCLSCGRILD